MGRVNRTGNPQRGNAGRMKPKIQYSSVSHCLPDSVLKREVRELSVLNDSKGPAAMLRTGAKCTFIGPSSKPTIA